MIAESLRDKVQCPACHNYAMVTEPTCPNCKAMMPKGVAERNVRARTLPTERGRQQAAYDRFKQEATYVPRWMRKVVLAFNYAYEDSGMHRLVQWGSGALGFFFAFTAAGPLVHLAPLPAKLAARLDLWLLLQFCAGALAFILTSRFIFGIYHTIVETMVEVFGDEQDALILQGTTRDKYRENFKGR